jgi:predicted hotdog family 3-hydroxylacyl-ACP dehydratase
MIERDVLLGLIPHQGSMCLLDGVRRWDAEAIHAFSQSHRDPAHPLRRDGRLAALHLCEYGAQAMAVHGGLLVSGSGGRARPGLLVSLRAVELGRDGIDDCDGDLDVHAQMLHADATGWQYSFRIEHRGETLASGRAAVMLRGDVA